MHNNINEMLGKTMMIVKNINNHTLRFIDFDGVKYEFYHEQDCCESVTIYDICGELLDLVGAPILLAEEVTNVGYGRLPFSDESFTWTFYKFATIKGSVTVRWYGESNGYYSEAVDFRVVR